MHDTNGRDTQAVQHVHAGRGKEGDRVLACAEPDPQLLRVPTIADVVPITEIMSRDLTCARRDLPADEVAGLMIRRHVGCIPVVDESGRPAGMITKLDLLEQSEAGVTVAMAGDVMMPLAIAVHERATIAHAAALMAGEDIHHLAVVDEDGRLVGIVSSMDIVRWLARNDGFSAANPG
jgi:CBS domain-containing protein